MSEEWSFTRTFHLWSVKRLISTDPSATWIATEFLYSNVLPHHFHCVQAVCCNGAWAVSVWWPITWPITDSTGCISASLCSLPTAGERELRMLLAPQFAVVLISEFQAVRAHSAFSPQIFTIISGRGVKQRKPAQLSRPHVGTAQCTVGLPQRSQSGLVREANGSPPSPWGLDPLVKHAMTWILLDILSSGCFDSEPEFPIHIYFCGEAKGEEDDNLSANLDHAVQVWALSWALFSLLFPCEGCTFQAT